ncbi:VOC family protein [Pseudomonas sp. B392_1p]|uniref:VOC family protein n=1 Tax=Pseudomonas sp. B392_1p TaxID=3457507 RepID=UPI003FD53CCB
MNVEGKLYQIGVVVRDLNAGMQHYRQLFGLGPFCRLDTNYTGRYRGTLQQIANRNAFARWGDLYLEMIEPGKGQSSASEWLAAKGEGIFHLGYATTNLEQRPGGVEVCFETIDSLTEEGQPAVIHLDTVEQLGYYVELADYRLAERLANWIDNTANRQDQ